MRADRTAWQRLATGLGSQKVVETTQRPPRSGVATGSFAMQGAIQTSCSPKASL